MMKMQLSRRARVPCAAVALGASALGSLLLSGTATALEPRSLTEPEVLERPGQVTDVVDALDGDSGIDLHFSLGYQHSWKRATLLRETQNPGVTPAAAAGIARVKVADYAGDTSRLSVRSELGLFHDLALIVRLPIILSHSTTLSPRFVPAAALDGAPDQALFTLPFRSPNRSGLEYLGIGVDWGILNQWRDAAQPTLVIGAETRLSLSEPMHACDTARCAYPSDIDRDGTSGEFVSEVEPGRSEALEGNFPATARKAGVSRGTTIIELHAWVSRRFRHVEPYLGFSGSIELPGEDSDFRRGAFRDGPPARGSFSLGAELMPWEAAEQFQRLSVDLRFVGTLSSEGQDYSELFDALGSSSAASYRQPNYSSYRENPEPSTSAAFPSVVDPDSERLFATGLTRVQGHGTYAVRFNARWQAGQYVHFDVGSALSLTQQHFLTLGQPCDPSSGVAVAAAGPCAVGEPGSARALGAPDPSYRPETDQPGRRFLVDTASTVDAWVGATVMF